MASEQRERKEIHQMWTQDRELIGNNAHGNRIRVLTAVK